LLTLDSCDRVFWFHHTSRSVVNDIVSNRKLRGLTDAQVLAAIDEAEDLLSIQKLVNYDRDGVFYEL
jgi:hypothetical protein